MTGSTGGGQYVAASPGVPQATAAASRASVELPPGLPSRGQWAGRAVGGADRGTAHGLPEAGRQRDLFPMPLVGEGPRAASSALGRRSQRRQGARIHHLHRLNAAISSLNSLYGCPSTVGDPVNESQRAAIDNLNTALHRLGRQPEQYAESRECEDGALEELLQGVAIYGDGAANPSVPYRREHISWPSSSSAPVELSTILGPTEAARLRDWRSQMLRPQREAEELKAAVCPKGAYCDRGLVGDPRTYADFLATLYSKGMVSFSEAADANGTVGVFFVPKKNAAQRIIFDTRIANCFFSERLERPDCLQPLPGAQWKSLPQGRSWRLRTWNALSTT